MASCLSVGGVGVNAPSILSCEPHPNSIKDKVLSTRHCYDPLRPTDLKGRERRRRGVLGTHARGSNLVWGVMWDIITQVNGHRSLTDVLNIQVHVFRGTPRGRQDGHLTGEEVQNMMLFLCLLGTSALQFGYPFMFV